MMSLGLLLRAPEVMVEVGVSSVSLPRRLIALAPLSRGWVGVTNGALFVDDGVFFWRHRAILTHLFIKAQSPVEKWRQTWHFAFWEQPVHLMHVGCVSALLLSPLHLGQIALCDSGAI